MSEHHKDDMFQAEVLQNEHLDSSHLNKKNGVLSHRVSSGIDS